MPVCAGFALTDGCGLNGKEHVACGCQRKLLHRRSCRHEAVDCSQNTSGHAELRRFQTLFASSHTVHRICGCTRQRARCIRRQTFRNFGEGPPCFVNAARYTKRCASEQFDRCQRILRVRFVWEVGPSLRQATCDRTLLCDRMGRMWCFRLR